MFSSNPTFGFFMDYLQEWHQAGAALFVQFVVPLSVWGAFLDGKGDIHSLEKAEPLQLKQLQAQKLNPEGTRLLALNFCDTWPSFTSLLTASKCDTLPIEGKPMPISILCNHFSGAWMEVGSCQND